MLEQRIQQHFFEIADLQYQSAQVLSRPIADAAQALLGCISAGGKLLVGGHGGAAALAQYFCATFVHRFERDRPGLAALALGADSVMLGTLAQHVGVAPVFAMQLQVLGQPGDVLLLLEGAGSEAGQGQATAQAVEVAHAKDMSVVLLRGPGDHPGLASLNETDVLVGVPHDSAARVLEMQLLVLHCLCDAVDLQLMGEQETP